MGMTKAMLGNETFRERNGKIPIRIMGYNSFWIGGGIGNFTFGTFCSRHNGGKLEDSIKEVMDTLKSNSAIYLLRMIEGMEDSKEQDVALRLANYKGELKNLFFIEYEKCWKEKVEPQLGRYSNLERHIIGVENGLE
ncbi:MAG: hypothetical protein V1886_01440 [archaeon]